MLSSASMGRFKLRRSKKIEDTSALIFRCGCGSCGAVLRVPFPKTYKMWHESVRAAGWEIAVASPHGTTPVVLDAMTRECAAREMPEVMDVVDQQRKQ